MSRVSQNMSKLMTNFSMTLRLPGSIDTGAKRKKYLYIQQLFRQLSVLQDKTDGRNDNVTASVTLGRTS